MLGTGPPFRPWSREPEPPGSGLSLRKQKTGLTLEPSDLGEVNETQAQGPSTKAQGPRPPPSRRSLRSLRGPLRHEGLEVERRKRGGCQGLPRCSMPSIPIKSLKTVAPLQPSPQKSPYACPSIPSATFCTHRWVSLVHGALYAIMPI